MRLQIKFYCVTGWHPAIETVILSPQSVILPVPTYRGACRRAPYYKHEIEVIATKTSMRKRLQSALRQAQDDRLGAQDDSLYHGEIK